MVDPEEWELKLLNGYIEDSCLRKTCMLIFERGKGYNKINVKEQNYLGICRRTNEPGL